MKAPSLVTLRGVAVCSTAIGATLPQPVLRPVAGRGVYVFVERYAVKLPRNLGFLEVLPGFETDGASIPWLARPIVGEPFDPDFIAPCAGVHDPLYVAQYFTRAVTDGIMFDLMCANTTRSRRRAPVFWGAVRAGGWWVWHNHTPGSIKAARRLVRLSTGPG